MTAKEIIETKIPKKLKEHPEIARGIGAVIAIELMGPGGGRWIVDMTKTPALVSLDPTAHAVTAISMETGVFEQMAGGNLDPQAAFLTGKIKVEGDLGIAIKLGGLLA